MKKILLIIVAVLIFSGCNKKSENEALLQSQIDEQKEQIEELQNQVEEQPKNNESENQQKANEEISKTEENKNSECYKIFYYENQYRPTNNKGQNYNYVSAKNNVNNYFKMKEEIKNQLIENYKSDEEYTKNDKLLVDSLINDIVNDYDEYLKIKSNCK